MGTAILLLVSASPAVGAPAASADQIASTDQQPDPVVLVNGLDSSAHSWSAYVGPSGFLASIGRQAFAVGDGQAPGLLSEGDTAKPFAATNTIAENAAVLRDYIAGVKRKTGARRVDLVAHSLGGLVARYYIARLMADRDVDELVMLGTPNEGSSCADLPSQLDIWTPATIELLPSYVTGIFNAQIQNRNGVSFYEVAGDPITAGFKSPCTPAPSDLAVSVGSAEGIGITAEHTSTVHTELRTSAAVFRDFVAPWLAKDHEAQTGSPGPAQDPLTQTQSAGLATGHVNSGGSVTQTLQIDGVSLATFSVFDPTRSLVVSVVGATGKAIQLDPNDNGYVEVDDPSSLVYLGYGFQNPHPGPWQVTLHATARTPSTGADFAIMAQVVGGAALTAQTSDLAPTVGHDVGITAALTLDGKPLTATSATATIRTPDGHREQVPLSAGSPSGAGLAGTWRPDKEGIQTITVDVHAVGANGMPVERVSLLAVEVIPTRGELARRALLLAAGGGAVIVTSVVAAIVAVVALRRKRRRRRRSLAEAGEA